MIGFLRVLQEENKIKFVQCFFIIYLCVFISAYVCPFTLGCKLASGVWLADWSDVAEFTEDRDDNTSETGATPSDESISSRSLLIDKMNMEEEEDTLGQLEN